MSIKKIDNYRIRLNEILGVNGNTFIGFNNLSKQQVVIKVLTKTQVAKKYHNNLQAFKHQVNMLHKIRKNASYVVHYLNLLETHNHFYIIQEFCKGGNLKKVLNQKRLTVVQSFKYMRHILKGFMQLIKKGFHHGNLTPSNILCHNGLMKLSDYGLQISSLNDDVSNQIKNTVYLAPEVLEGKKYSDKSDIWSLGFIFYEMLYGTVPWKTGGFVKTYIERLKNEPLHFPSQPQVSNQLKSLIKGCLALDPNKRLDWSDIYLNDIFNGQFMEIQSIDIKMGYILGSIRNSLNHSNLDIQRYLKWQKITIETTLDLQSFKRLLFYMDHYLSMEDVKYLFDIFDNTNTKMIEFCQLINALDNFDISLQFQPLGRKSKKKHENLQNKQLVKQDPLLRALCKLVNQIREKKIIDICNLFSQMEEHTNETLDWAMFCSMLRTIQPKLTDDECRMIFRKIDINNDRQITYKQFLRSICLFTGSPFIYEKQK